MRRCLRSGISSPCGGPDGFSGTALSFHGHFNPTGPCPACSRIELKMKSGGGLEERLAGQCNLLDVTMICATTPAHYSKLTQSAFEPRIFPPKLRRVTCIELRGLVQLALRFASASAPAV
jgi:hypothetical protein